MEQYLKDLARRKSQIERLSLSGDIAGACRDGLSVGSVVKVERVAPLGDPVEISVRGYKLTLRKKDLERVVVSRLISARLSFFHTKLGKTNFIARNKRRIMNENDKNSARR
jgi:hypothetical protein